MRTEQVELTVLCLIHKDGSYLLQDRVKNDWKGYTLPGGHIEPGESIVEAVIREMKEETGLTIKNPRLCGVKQFPIDGGRYIVFLFETDQFEGELADSEEGKMHWIKDSDLSNVNLVNDFEELIEVYSMASEVERKQFMQTFIDRIDIFPERREDGNWIKNISFKFYVPVMKEGKAPANIKGITLDKEDNTGDLVPLEKLMTLETSFLYGFLHY